jgi:hypothetical protein
MLGVHIMYSKQIKITVEYRTTSNWRHIMTTPELSYCGMKKSGNSFPQFLKIFEDFKHNALGNISIDCPAAPRKIYLNLTEFMGNEDQYRNPVDMSEVPRNGFGVHLPNGKYRFTVRGSTKADPNAFFVQWIVEIRVRLQEDNF